MENQKNLSLLAQAQGTIPYNMTNDYMFRAVLQSNNKVLCGLIRSLLHIPNEAVLTAEIKNPIILGTTLKQKEFRLDVNAMVNHTKLINLEMQVTNQLNWSNRSLSYVCRSFDQLNHGKDYNSIRPVIHIGFLDYTLFKEYPEFYACYKMMNIKNQHIYSDNLDLRVLNLTQINLATDEDKQFRIDYWAALFKTTTWEGLNMLASKDKYLAEASNTIFQLSADEAIRKCCLDREDYYSDLRSYQQAIIEKDTALKEKDLEIAKLKAQLEQK